MASAGIPGMVGFISEFLVFRGSFLIFPVQTLLCMVGSGLTAVYFLLLAEQGVFWTACDRASSLLSPTRCLHSPRHLAGPTPRPGPGLDDCRLWACSPIGWPAGANTLPWPCTNPIRAYVQAKLEQNYPGPDRLGAEAIAEYLLP